MLRRNQMKMDGQDRYSRLCAHSLPHPERIGQEKCLFHDFHPYTSLKPSSNKKGGPADPFRRKENPALQLSWLEDANNPNLFEPIIWCIKNTYSPLAMMVPGSRILHSGLPEF